ASIPAWSPRSPCARWARIACSGCSCRNTIRPATVCAWAAWSPRISKSLPRSNTSARFSKPPDATGAATKPSVRSSRNTARAGAADLKPIAKLYKSQIYQLAAYLGIPEDIQGRQPTTGTYSMPQSQEEFFFPVAHEPMDLCLLGKDTGARPDQVAEACGMGT